jgi:alpha-tubulin suppressor-like RCC1 family protein
MVYSFGKGAYHRLGVDTLNNVYEPILIKELNNKEIVKIAAGCRHVLCLTEAGQVYSWGFNLYNQIGVPTEQDVKTPILVIFPVGFFIQPALKVKSAET